MTNDSNSCQTTNPNAVRYPKFRMARPATVLMAALLLLGAGCGRSRAAADAEDPLADAWQALQVNARHFPESLYTVMREAWDARHEAKRRTLRPAEPMQGMAILVHDDKWQAVAGGQTWKCDYNLFLAEARRQDAGATQKSMTFSVFDQDGKLYFAMQASTIGDGRSVQRRAKIVWRSGAQLMVSAVLPEFIPSLVPPISVNEYVPHSKTLVTMLDNDGQTYLNYDLESRRFVPMHVTCKDTPTGYLLTLRLTLSNYEVSMDFDRSIRVVEFTAGGIRYVLADEDEIEQDFASPEGIMSIEAPLDCWLPDGTETEALELRLHFSRDARLPTTARQSVDTEEAAKALLVRVGPETPPAEGAARLVISDETRVYLEPDRMHQSDHPDIVKMANTIVEGIADPAARCKALADWIRTNIAYTLEVAIGDAHQTLQTRKGDCTEYAALFIAFARALGIPAREVSGWMIGDASATGHAWCEVHLGDRWYEIDPGAEHLWIGARYISQLRNHIYSLERVELVSWTAHGKRVVPDKTRPLWTLRNGVYHNRIYGIRVRIPGNTVFFAHSDGTLSINVREGRAVPGDIDSSLFTLSQPLKEKGKNSVFSFALLSPETCQQAFTSGLDGLGGAIQGMVLVETVQFESEIGNIVAGRTREGAIIYLLPPRETGSYHIMVAYLTVGSDGILPAAEISQLPESVIDLWRRVEVGEPDLEIQT